MHAQNGAHKPPSCVATAAEYADLGWLRLMLNRGGILSPKQVARRAFFDLYMYFCDQEGFRNDPEL